MTSRVAAGVRETMPLYFKVVSTRNYWKIQALHSDRRVMIRKSRSKATTFGNELKRLQRRHNWKTPENREYRRVEMANRHRRKQNRQKLRLLRARRTLVSPICKLWTCHRRRGFRQEKKCERMGGDRRRMNRCNSRISMLSDLSVR